MIAPELAERHILARSLIHAESERKIRDPLSVYQHSSESSEWLCENISRGWIYWHAANSAGKSQSLASLWAAFMQGRTSLGVEGDGIFYNGEPWHSRAIEIPYIRPPVAGAIGTPTYKLGAAGSIIDKVREAIGEWPHHEERIAGSVSVFHVMHKDKPSQNWSRDYSKLYVLPYSAPLPEGLRLDFFGPDEPPPAPWLEAILNRGKAGRPLYGAIGATPTLRLKWQPMRDQFPKATRVFFDGRASLQSSVYENRFLTAEDIQRQEWANPPSKRLSKARLLGEHVDDTGDCPFDVPTLERMMLEWGADAIEVVTLKVQFEERNLVGAPKLVREVPVEIFQRYRGNPCIVTIDPSSGVEDLKHHPYEVEVVEVGSGDLMARAGVMDGDPTSGRMAGKLVGILAARLARVDYGGAKINPEVNDRWGVNVVEGVQAVGYNNWLTEKRELRPGEFATEIGFHNTAQSRPIMVGAVQSWVEAYRAGTPYARCAARQVYKQLLDCIVDPTGKVVADPSTKHHAEALIVWGQSLHRAVSRRGVAIPAIQRPILTPAQVDDARMAARIMGQRSKNGHGQPRGVGLLRTERP